jgi:acetylornithine/succinyldiaminopimelate/putrescine aminotransferase
MAVGDHGSTFAAGPVACRAAEVVLKRVSDPALLTHIAQMGELIMDRLNELNSAHIQEVRGMGLMIGVEMDMEVMPIIQKGFDHGLLLLNAGPNVLRLLPPYIITELHVDAFITKLQTILTEIDAV